jgi:ABC-type glycerol-3-phosphate transport system substrate-binding protein
MSDDTAPKATLLGKLVILLVLAGCGYLAWHFLIAKPTSTEPAPGAAAPTRVQPSGTATRIAVGYGTEKERWLKWAVEEFAKTEPAIQVELVAKGSLEGAQALLAGEQLHIWAPASSLYTATFAADWQVKHAATPFARSETLALTPMVCVWWAERFAALKKPPQTFRDIATLIAEPTGWAGLAGKPEWGFLKFGHAHPNQSNSGLMSLVLMAHDYHQARQLGMAQVMDAGFQTWLIAFEKGVAGLSHSTGAQMKEMVLKGPSAYDGLCVYESVAIDFLRNAQGRWGDLRVTYPAPNAWNDNPAYVIAAPWNSPAQREAAGRFLDFLMAPTAQRKALDHGFRPGDPAVPIKEAGSPFIELAKYGLRVDLPQVIEQPSGEVIANLLAGWQRAVGR